MLQICRTSLAQRLDGMHTSRMERGAGESRRERESAYEFLYGNEGVLRKTSMSSSECSGPLQPYHACYEHGHSNKDMSGRGGIHASEEDQDGLTPLSPLLSSKVLESDSMSGAFTQNQDKNDDMVVTRYTMVLTHALSLLCYLRLIRCDVIIS
jgi:hypothetical protein